MPGSIFTKIIKGEIPSHKIYEDEKTFAFLDIHPAQPGHVLVVPKNEARWIWDMSEEDYIALMNSVKKIGSSMRKVLAPKHIGISVEGVGVPHVHVHLIPFTTQEEFHRLADQDAEPDHEALAKIAAKLAF
jgi:histidine triad (HIT) family protein